MNNLNSIVDYLKVFNNINKRPAQEPRNMYSQGQLVQNTADGSRPGYDGKKPFLDQTKFIEEFTTQRIKGDMTGPKFVEYLNENYSPSTQTDAFNIDNVDRRLRKAQEKKLIAKDIVTKGSTADRALTSEKYISVIGEEEYAKLKDSPTQLKDHYEFELNKKNNPNFLDIRKERTKKWKTSLTPDQYREKVTIPAAEYKAKKFPTKFAVDRNNAKSMAWKDLVSRTYDYDISKKKSKGTPYFKFETPLEKGKNYNTADMKDIVLKDKKGNRFTFDTLFDDIQKVADKDEFKSFKNTYDQRAFLNKEGITTELNKLYGNKLGARKSVFNIQHIEGFNKKPFKVHLTFATQNAAENKSRRIFTEKFGKASEIPLDGKGTRFKAQRAAINNYYKSLGPDIVAQIGRKPKGEAKTLINLLDKSGIKLTDTQRAGAEVLSNFWCGTRKASGGRVSFAAGSGCPDSVKKKNFLMLTDDVAKGRVTGEAAEQIAKNAGKVVAKAGSKSAFASIFGPAGIGLDIVYEVGSIGFDMAMDSNVSLKGALQNNWLTGAFIEGTGQEEYNKGLVKFDSSAKPMATIQNLIEKIESEEKNLERIKTNLVRGDYTGWAKKEIIAKQEEVIKNLYNDFNKVSRKVDAGAAGQHGDRYLALEEGSKEQIAYNQAKQEYDSIGAARTSQGQDRGIDITSSIDQTMAPEKEISGKYISKAKGPTLLKKSSKAGFEESLKSSRAEPWIDFGLLKNPQYGKFSKRELDKRLKQFGDYAGYGWTPYGHDLGMQQMKPGIGDKKYNKDLGYRELSEIMAKSEATDRIAQAGGVSKMAQGGIMSLNKKKW